MENFQIDFTEIANMLDPNKIPMKGNESKIIRVAFDLFRVDGDEADDLWQLQADDDGNEFLVRTYSLPDDEKTIEASEWSVLADKKYANLTISFKGLPITRLASKDYGAKTLYDGKTLQGIVFHKLSSDGEFVFNLIANLSKEKRAALKQAGLVDDLKNWLQSRDITEPIIEKILDLIEEKPTEKKSKKSQWDIAFSNIKKMADDEGDLAPPGMKGLEYYEQSKQTFEEDEEEETKGSSAEEVKTILEQTGGSVTYRPSTFGFSYIVQYQNGYSLSVVSYGDSDFSVREKPDEGSKWEGVECSIKDKDGNVVDPKTLGIEHSDGTVFGADIVKLFSIGKKISDLDSTGSKDEWSLAFLDMKLKKTAKDTGYSGPIETQTEKNKNFRKVLFTGDHCQLVLMSIKGGEEIGVEVHKSIDQFFRVEKGEAIFVLDGKKKRIKAGGAIVIPSGTEHNVINASDTEPLKLYTIYSPPNHPPGTIQKTKEDAKKSEKKAGLASLGLPRFANVQDNPDFYHLGNGSSGVDIVNMVQNSDDSCDVCGHSISDCQCGKY
jgi:mannose-6-phosphate isomerase-like protein (cupin superfamily)